MERIVLIRGDVLLNVGERVLFLTEWWPLRSDYKQMTEYDEQLDARGLSCPLPILKAKKRLHELGAGKVLSVLADDPGSVKDFEAFTKQTGNELVEFRDMTDHYRFVLRKVA